MITSEKIITMVKSKVTISDPLFSSYVNVLNEQSLSYQWEVLNDNAEGAEKSYCIHNFRVAAGEASGGHMGAVFQDTDLYKWMEAAAFCYQNGGSEEYLFRLEEAAALIGRAQEPDGYINTYFTIECPDKKWTNLVEGHELYSGGHLIEAAVAYYYAVGRKELLEVACRFADLVYQMFGTEEGKCHGYPGHQEIELALVKLYGATGQKKYLELADYFIRQRGQEPNYLWEEYKGRNGKNIFPEFCEYDPKYAQIHKPALEQETAVGHSVRATYMYSAMADLARLEKDEEMAKACGRIFDNIVNRRMYLTGGIGSSGKLERFTTDYDLPNDRMYGESCASIGLMMFAQRMASLTGEASYYDTVERALCNTVLAGISKEGDRYFYVNPLEVWPQNCLDSTSMSHVKPIRQKWFSTACCPPNIARTLVSLGQYIYAQSENSFYINQFISSAVTACIGEACVSFELESDYMQSGTVRMRAICSGELGEKYLRIRIPDYLQKPVLIINGEQISAKTEKGYAVIPLSEKLKIEINAFVPPRYVAANRNVRADVGKLAVMKGPYVYCMEEEDNGENLSTICFSSQNQIREIVPEFGLPGNLPMLEISAGRLKQTMEKPEDLYGTPCFEMEPVNVKLIPYALWCNRTPGEMQVWTNALPASGSMS